MRSLLSRLGHRAVIATNGEAALESWQAARSAGTPYDLVLMDIQMPQLDGIETTTPHPRGLEASEPGRRTPILALTANTLVEDRYACFEAGHGRLSDQAARSREAGARRWRASPRGRHIAAKFDCVTRFDSSSLRSAHRARLEAMQAPVCGRQWLHHAFGYCTMSGVEPPTTAAAAPRSR